MGTHKMSDDNYIKKLQEKEITIIPIEKYKGINQSILHKCHCGIKRKISPKKVLNGKNKCTCIVKNTDIYLQKLKLKDIKVYPLEDYKGTHNKILHKCYCGKNWMIAPSVILADKNVGCGCRVLGRSIEHYRGRKTILYYIKVNELWKIGIKLYDEKYKNIQDNLLKGRFGLKQYKDCNFEILKTKIYENGEEAYLLEQTILEEFKEYKYIKDDMGWFGGHTELFTEDIDKI